MRITFVTLDSIFANIAEENGYNVYLGKVQDYKPQSDSGSIYYVSPSNTLNFMDGGIDYAYSRIMFPGIEYKIKETIKELPYRTFLGRPFLPIGKAIVTKTDIFSLTGNPCYIISSPTMLLPQDVSKTPNAFLSIIAIIQLLKKIKDTYNIKDNDELILTSMCCGVGKMNADISFKQIQGALEHNDPENISIDIGKIIGLQPNYYANTEWKNIDSDKIIKE